MPLSLADYFPAAFPALALAHFVALISPGADFFLIIGHAARHGFKGSVLICLGIALANAVYIALAIIGWSVVRDYPLLFVLVECLGAGYLLWIGYALIRSSRRDGAALATDSQSVRLSLGLQWLTGFCSGILNPKNFIFYMSLMTGILGNQVTRTQQMTCGLWMFLMVLLWDAMIAQVIGHPRVMRCFARQIHLIERGVGAVLMLISVGIFYSLLHP